MSQPTYLTTHCNYIYDISEYHEQPASATESIIV